MLRGNPNDCGRHFITHEQRYAILLMRYDRLCAFQRRKLIVDILPIFLVLFKVQRAAQLSHIVKQRAHTCKQRICSHALSCCLRKRCHHNRMLVCPRRFHHELLEQRMVCIAQLAQARGGCNIKHGFPN